MTSRFALLAVTLLAAPSLVPTPALAQRPVLTEDVDQPARTPYQRAIVFNQGSNTCDPFSCTVQFDVVPAGKRLEITYVSALFGAPGDGATIVVQSDPSFSSTRLYLPLPQTYGFHTYVGGSPVTFYVDAGHTPTLILGGFNVSSSSTSAEATIVGHYVSVP